MSKASGEAPVARTLPQVNWPTLSFHGHASETPQVLQCVLDFALHRIHGSIRINRRHSGPTVASCLT